MKKTYLLFLIFANIFAQPDRSPSSYKTSYELACKIVLDAAKNQTIVDIDSLTQIAKTAIDVSQDLNPSITLSTDTIKTNIEECSNFLSNIRNIQEQKFKLEIKSDEVTETYLRNKNTTYNFFTQYELFDNFKKSTNEEVEQMDELRSQQKEVIDKFKNQTAKYVKFASIDLNIEYSDNETMFSDLFSEFVLFCQHICKVEKMTPILFNNIRSKILLDAIKRYNNAIKTLSSYRTKHLLTLIKIKSPTLIIQNQTIMPQYLIIEMMKEKAVENIMKSQEVQNAIAEKSINSSESEEESESVENPIIISSTRKRKQCCIIQ